MKKLFTLILAMMMGISVPSGLQANVYNDDWTCYTSNNYKGSKKTMQEGEYNNCTNWNYYSWKSTGCIKFYYYYKDGKKGDKVLCGDIQDLKNEMKNWGNLKYGYQGGWKNIYKAVLYYEGGNNQTAGNNNGNYNDILKKGHCAAWKANNYAQDYTGYQPGKKYYPKDLKYKFWSLHCPDNYEVYWVYKSKNGKNEEYTCSGKIADLKTHFYKWNVQNKNNAWDYVQYFEIRKKGMGGNNQTAGNNNGNYNDILKKGHCVAWKGSSYAEDYTGYQPGKKYYPKDLQYKFWSLHCPGDYEVYWVYKSKNGKNEEYTCGGKIADLKTHFYKWNVQNKNNAWDYVQYFEIRKKGMGGNNYGKDEAYKNKDWYNKYKNGGYIVFTQYPYFDGKYSAKVPGDYNDKKLGFYPQSIFIPNYSIYLVLEYKGKDGKTKSTTLKESVADLGKLLYDYGVYKDYNKDPYKAITRLAVIRQ